MEAKLLHKARSRHSSLPFSDLQVLKHRHHLLALHGRKPRKKILNGIAVLQMVEQTPNRHSRAGEDQFATENLWIL